MWKEIVIHLLIQLSANGQYMQPPYSNTWSGRYVGQLPPQVQYHGQWPPQAPYQPYQWQYERQPQYRSFPQKTIYPIAEVVEYPNRQPLPGQGQYGQPQPGQGQYRQPQPRQGGQYGQRPYGQQTISGVYRPYINYPYGNDPNSVFDRSSYIPNVVATCRPERCYYSCRLKLLGGGRCTIGGCMCYVGFFNADGSPTVSYYPEDGFWYTLSEKQKKIIQQKIALNRPKRPSRPNYVPDDQSTSRPPYTYRPSTSRPPYNGNGWDNDDQGSGFDWSDNDDDDDGWGGDNDDDGWGGDDDDDDDWK